jgi:mono/diheme cytochrome c family protein
MKPLWLMAASIAILSASPSEGVAQAKANTTSTLAGVYNREQANRGGDVYLAMCKNCHSAETHTGPAFTTKWNGKALSELYAYISDLMPKNAPGTLTPEENADVLAYVLKMNRMPEGGAELPPNPDKMKSIRIETTRPARKSP